MLDENVVWRDVVRGGLAMKKPLFVCVLALILFSACTNPYMNRAFVRVDNQSTFAIDVVFAATFQNVAPVTVTAYQEPWITYSAAPQELKAAKTGDPLTLYAMQDVSFGGKYTIHATQDALSNLKFTITKD